MSLRKKEGEEVSCIEGELGKQRTAARKCRNEGGENRWEEQVLFSFFLCGTALD